MTDPHFPFALVLEVKTTKMCDGVKNGLLQKLLKVVKVKWLTGWTLMTFLISEDTFDKQYKLLITNLQACNYKFISF